MFNKDINAIYVMILNSDKPIRKIIEGYNIKLPFSEIHNSLTYLSRYISDYEELRVILDLNIEFLHKHLI